MRRLFALLAVSCVTQGPSQQTSAAGPWRASWRDWTRVDVCETEPSWLLDELTETNELLQRFTGKGGTWRDDELPVLEDAVKALTPLVEAHEKNLAAMAKCPYAQSGVYREAVEKSVALTKAARAELEGAPKLIAFVRHRHQLEQWQKQLAEDREATRARCEGDAGLPSHVYFAWSDELDGTTWLFCDGAVVNAPLVGPLELRAAPESWPAAQAKELKAKCFELARVYPPGQIRQPPR